MIDPIDALVQAHQYTQDATKKADLNGWWRGFSEGYTAACIDQADGIQPGPSRGVQERNRLWREYNQPGPVTPFPQALKEAS